MLFSVAFEVEKMLCVDKENLLVLSWLEEIDRQKADQNQIESFILAGTFLV